MLKRLVQDSIASSMPCRNEWHISSMQYQSSMPHEQCAAPAIRGLPTGRERCGQMRTQPGPGSCLHGGGSLQCDDCFVSVQHQPQDGVSRNAACQQGEHQGEPGDSESMHRHCCMLQCCVRPSTRRRSWRWTGPTVGACNRTPPDVSCI